MRQFPSSDTGNWLKLIFQGVVPAFVIAIGGWVWAIDRNVTAIQANRFTATDALEMKAELTAVSTAQLELLASLKADHGIQQAQIEDLRRDVEDIRRRLNGK